MWRFFKDNSGAAAVEFVLCMPFLVTLSIGASELGRGLWCYHTLVQTTRDASRYLSHLPPGGTVISPTVVSAYQTIADRLIQCGIAKTAACAQSELLIPSGYGTVTTSYSITPVAGTWSVTQPANAYYVTATANLTFTSQLISWLGMNTNIPISVSHSERIQTD